jgi:hypothetical protein
MSGADRGTIVDASRKIAQDVQGGNSDAVKAETIPSVAANFTSIAQTIQNLAPLVSKATLTVDSVFLLDASSNQAPEDTQFFCGSGSAASGEVSFNIPQLPPATYSFAILHATGVPKPQQLSLLMQRDGQAWKLAGFFAKPMLAAGHDGLWYWRAARTYAKQKQNWNAYFYYTTAAYLLAPVSFIETANLDKLVQEENSARPAGLPGDKPMTLSAGGQSFAITSLRTDDALGGLDLVVRYTAVSNSDPAAARARTLEVMKALLAAHPELRAAFHGLWVFSDAPGQPPFALELPMDQIR